MNTSIGKSDAQLSPAGVLLLVGPSVSVMLVRALATEGLMPEAWVGTVAATMLALVWSPLFCSIPALMMQDVRDEILPGERRITRAALLVPALLAPESPVRAQQKLSLYGLAAGTLLLAL